MAEFNEQTPTNSVQEQPKVKQGSLTIFKRVLSNYDFRHFETVLYSAAFFSMGIAVSSTGVTIVDLAEICKVSIEKASFLFTVFGLGLISSTLVFYLLGRKIHSSLKQCVYLTTLTIGFLCISWVENFKGMLIIFFINGFGTAGQSLTGNTRMNDIWQEKTGPYMQILHTTFPLSGILTPIIFKPFLSRMITNNSTSFNLTLQSNQTKESAEPSQSRIYIPYTLFSAYSFIMVFCFAFAYVKRKNIRIPKLDILYKSNTEKKFNNDKVRNEENEELDKSASEKEGKEEKEGEEGKQVEKDRRKIGEENNDKKIETSELRLLKKEEEREDIEAEEGIGAERMEKNLKLVNRLRIICNVLFCFTAFLQAGREYLLNSLIMPYCIECLGWGKIEGADVIMATYLTYAALRLANIFILKRVKVIYLVVYNFVTALIFAIFFISINHSNRVFLWVGIIGNAFSVGATFTITLLWSRSFLKVTPRFVASFLLCFYIGMSSWPVLTTYLFTEIHCFWYPTINLVLSLSWMLIIAILFFIQINKSRYIIIR